MSTESIREYVLQQCRRPENIFGPAFFDEHLAVVAFYANRLAERLGADPEIVELAAYLHDLSAVRDASTMPDHANMSAALARRLLPEYGYPPEVAGSVARCVASHSAPVQIGSGSIEEICVSSADAISQIARPAYWLYFAFRVRNCGFEEGRQWLLQRVESNWNSLGQPARELAETRYARALDVLGTGTM